jgi:hypothetical protein
MAGLRHRSGAFSQCRHGATAYLLYALHGRTMPVSARIIRNGKQIGTADPAACGFVDREPPRGEVKYSVGFALSDGYTFTPETAFGGRPEDLEGELGILDLKHNGGINPVTIRTWRAGDPYRQVFVSGEKTTATSPDPATTTHSSPGLPRRPTGRTCRILPDHANHADLGADLRQWRRAMPESHRRVCRADIMLSE